MAKTMNAGLTELMGNDAKPSGASFLEVLSGTSALSSLPSPGSFPQTPGSNPQENSATPDQGAQQANLQTTANTENQQPIQNNLPQTLLAAAFAAQKPAVTQSVATSSQSHSAVTGTTRANEHQVNTQSANTAPPANIAVPVNVAPPADCSAAPPVVSTGQAIGTSEAQQSNATAATGISDEGQINTALAVHILNAQVVNAVPTADIAGMRPAGAPDAQPAKAASLSMPTIPSPTPSVPDQAQTQVANHAQADLIAGVSAKTISMQALPVEHTDSQNENKSQASTAKSNDNGTSSADANTSAQTAQATPSAPTNNQTTGNSNTVAIPAIVVLPNSEILPSMNLMPGAGDLSSLSGNAAQGSKASDASFTKPPDTATATDTKKNNETSATATSSSDSQNNVASNGQTTQRGQTDGSQSAPVAPKAADTTAAQAATQIQSIASHGAAHELAGSQGRGEGGADTVRSDRPAAAETPENAATPGINTANVIQKMSETEMRIGVHSADFGDVSIRTLVSQQQMTAQISVDHSDLGKAISAHIPAMEAKLGGDFGLRAMVEVNQSSMSFSGERGFSSQREQKSYAQPTQNENATISAETDQPALRVATGPGDAYRLDIRA